MNLETLKRKVESGEIDTVVAAIPDMQGRLMGKRFSARHFIEEACEETHCCNYLVATDMEMHTVDGYASTSWEAGYGDYTMKPDQGTLRELPWMEGTALILCDLYDHNTHELVPHAPRTILRRQLEAASEMGYEALCATELEFFTFRDSYEQARDLDYRGMTRISPYNEDYHIFQTAKEEGLMRAIRNGLVGAGIRVENTKGEADAGQGEINVRYDGMLRMADCHAIAKNSIKEIALQHGRAITFMAKWSHDAAGSSCHIHQSLRGMGGKAAFRDPEDGRGMSKLMRHYLAGLLAHATETTFFLAPYVNSYKRFSALTFAPTKAVWSVDNRTAGYRIVGCGTDAVRIECRVGGADLNPYLALASQLAAGLAGIRDELELEPEFTGDAYQAKRARSIPANLPAAVEAMRKSKMLRSAWGDEVVDHYVRAGSWEQEHFEQQVTDYEVRRGFERA